MLSQSSSRRLSAFPAYLCHLLILFRRTLYTPIGLHLQFHLVHIRDALRVRSGNESVMSWPLRAGPVVLCGAANALVLFSLPLWR